jgi:hypothetical protein
LWRGFVSARAGALTRNDAHQPHGIRQHVVVAPDPLLEGKVEGLGFLGRPSRGSCQGRKSVLDSGLDFTGTQAGLFGHAGRAFVHFDHSAFDVRKGTGHSIHGALQALNGILSSGVNEISGLGDDTPGILYAVISSLVSLLGGIE